MAKAGRKSWTEELEIAERYTALSVPFFKYLKKMIESDSDEDKKWAVERLEKAFVKMIPQKLGGDGGGVPFMVQIVKYADDADDTNTIQLS